MGSLYLDPHEPIVWITVGGQTLPFMVDTGAERSVVTTAVTPPSRHKISIVGATRWPSGRRVFCQDRTVEHGGHQVKHEFLYMPECLVLLLGHDLRSKLGAQISFRPSGEAYLQVGTTHLITTLVPREEEYQLYKGAEEGQREPTEGRKIGLRKKYPKVWAEENPPGLTRNHSPITIELKPGAGLRQIRQYPIPRTARLGIAEVIQKHLREGILVPCRSPWNIPLLPVKKPDGSGYRPVQDL